MDCRMCTFYRRWWSADTIHDWCEFADDEIPEVKTGECDFFVSVDCNYSEN